MLRLSAHLTVVTALLAAACACGKGGDKAPAKAGEGPTGPGSAGSAGGSAAAPPGKAPVTAPSRGPERVVYSLADNRLAAHLGRGGGLLLPAGSTGFAKYVRFGNTLRGSKAPWETRQRQGEVPVARMLGTSGALDVPVGASEAAASVVRVRAFSAGAGPRAYSLRVNGNKDVAAQVAPGWSTVEFTVPTGQLKDGENELLFFVGGGAGLDVAWIQVGGTAPTAPEAEVTTFWSSADRALVLPQAGSMSWFVTVPEQGRVTGNLADGACEVAVLATGADGTTIDGKLTGLGSAVDLSALAGKAARLDLTAAGCARAQLTDAALVVPGDAPKVVRGEAPKYVVLWIMDSLRADRIKTFNPEARPDVPTFEKLAETGAVFLQNYVQGNESRVSHASIWSALYPVKHKMVGEKDRLAEAWTTIDEVAKKAGKFVAGASGNGYIRPKRGFGTAWDKFSNHIEEELPLRGQDLLDKGLSFIDGKKEPWFLYVGTIDTHVSWRSKEPWMSKYDPGYTGRFADQFSGADAAASAGGKLTLTEREKDHVRAMYDANVSYQDDLLRQLIEKLTTWGIWDQTMLIVTADHGDEQWEDGRVGHGASMRDMLVHVPLLIHYPPLLPAGKFGEGTDVVDIVPTVADALGVAIDPEWQGESLLPLTHGVGRGYPRLSFNSMYEDHHAGRIGRWKARVSGAGAVRIFDVVADPAEKAEATGKAAAIGGRMVLDAVWTMRHFGADWKKAQWGNAANVTARFAADQGE
ncbi:MAG: sulfatase-like hydrolase/transferase [Kofleriaceae bacterium]|nr:sulfatase-like hydrolase/transferase [Kofleriaceae bacterium]MBP6842009.1 sulfatase-like hydrolase/transferase [Kofleriaceae bacterium]MBP9208381.1 sulfatase-like hydrolase/transferase [Kofleriaceae bacterium]